MRKSNMQQNKMYKIIAENHQVMTTTNKKKKEQNQKKKGKRKKEKYACAKNRKYFGN